MFTKSSNVKSIDDEIQHVLTGLGKMDKVDSEEYKKAVENLKTLCDARSFKKPPRWGIEPEAVLMAVTNILGIVLVLNYEQLRPLTSKAINLIAKGRI